MWLGRRGFGEGEGRVGDEAGGGARDAASRHRVSLTHRRRYMGERLD
jgi:hypothetical protein